MFTELAQAPLDADTLAKRLNLHPRSVRDFLDALVALQMLERHGEHYRNTPETNQFLDWAKPSYIGGILEMCNTSHRRCNRLNASMMLIQSVLSAVRQVDNGSSSSSSDSESDVSRPARISALCVFEMNC